MKINHQIKCFILVILFISSPVMGQIDSVINNRISFSSGVVFSGNGYSGMGSLHTAFQSSGVLTQLANGKFLEPSFGFMAAPKLLVEDNRAPVALDQEVFLDFEESNLIQVFAFDPEGEELDLKFIQKPNLGKLKEVKDDKKGKGKKKGKKEKSESFSKSFVYEPNNELIAGRTYTDSFQFYVKEKGKKSNESNTATITIHFTVLDLPHKIKGLRITDSKTERHFELEFDDKQFNESYTVLVTYLDKSDKKNPSTKVLIDQQFLLSDLNTDKKKLSATWSIALPEKHKGKKKSEAYLFKAKQLEVTASVTSDVGLEAVKSFELDNKAKKQKNNKSNKADGTLLITEEQVLSMHNSLNIELYPNPAKTAVNLILGGDIKQWRKVSIVDINGKSYWSIQHPEEHQIKIDLSNMKSGIYLIKAAGNEQTAIKKLMVID